MLSPSYLQCLVQLKFPPAQPKHVWSSHQWPLWPQWPWVWPCPGGSRPGCIVAYVLPSWGGHVAWNVQQLAASQSHRKPQQFELSGRHNGHDSFLQGEWVNRSSPETTYNDFIAMQMVGTKPVHNLKIWTVTSDLPWTPSSVRLPVESALSAFRKGIGGVIIEMLVSVLQTR